MPMAQKLLLGKLLKTLHIVFFLLPILIGFQVSAQSVLLPGDVVIVSANADTNSIDFIPLIDIREGTTLYFSNGVWDENLHKLEGDELHITFNERITAGTNFHINQVMDSRLTVSGSLEFTGGTHRLFAYQKEAGIYRFVFGLGWGKGTIWNTTAQDKSGSDIPESLRTNPQTLVTLGEASNYQYFVRNGASGTRKLLLKFVGDAAHWRGRELRPYSTFGTSFNLLSPPIVLFERSVSTVQESDSTATLNVAIYEHNGSRLSVDVVFDSLRSIASSNDFNDFKSSTLNFTGLIGDGMYEVEIPIIDDKEYEGRETGIFVLKNLTGGNFGDFLSHSLVIMDNEKPEVLITNIQNTPDQPGYAEIHNTEDGVVSLNNWVLRGRNQSFTFPDTAILYPGETLRWMDQPLKDKKASEDVIYSNLKKPLLEEKGGVLTLLDYKGNIINQVTYNRGEKANQNEEARKEEPIAQAADMSSNVQEESAPQTSVLKATNPGYKFLMYPENIAEKLADKNLLNWNEEDQAYHTITPDDGNTLPKVAFGYFDNSELEQLKDWKTKSLQKKAPEPDLVFTLSVTDKNENEEIDGLEGLNLVFNNLDEAISVNQLTKALQEKYTELHVSPVFYAIQPNSLGELSFVKMNAEEEIDANTPFWIIMNQPLEVQKVVIKREALQAKGTPAEEDFGLAEGVGQFQFSIKKKDFEETAGLTITDETSVTSVRALNSYPELFLPHQSFLNASFSQGVDYFKELLISPRLNQTLTLPVEFSTTENGPFTFSVTRWEEIPQDWSMVLTDLKTEKEYVFRKGFSMNFEHTAGSVEDIENLDMDDFKVSDRFVILVTPPNAPATSEDEVADAPRELELRQNFPNPFNPVTTISFYLPETEEVRLSIFNIVGQPVAVLVEGPLSAGEQQFDWDATDKPSGMYIYQLEVGKNVMTRKMTLVK